MPYPPKAMPQTHCPQIRVFCQNPQRQVSQRDSAFTGNQTLTRSGPAELSPRCDGAGAAIEDGPPLVHGLASIVHDLSCLAEDAAEVAAEVATAVFAETQACK